MLAIQAMSLPDGMLLASGKEYVYISYLYPLLGVVQTSPWQIAKLSRVALHEGHYL